MARNNFDSSMEESPLLSGRKSSTLHSTIHPDKLDHARFSERLELENEGGSSLRIIIYVVIVIAIGVGSALLIRTLITKNEKTDDNDTQTQDTEEETPDTVEATNINTKAEPDSSASLLAEDSEYVESALLSLGTTSVDGASLSVDDVTYQKYESFGRVVFDISGTKLASTGIQFDSVSDRLTVDLSSYGSIDTKIAKDFNIGDIVDEIRYNPNNKTYIIFFAEDSRYRVTEDAGDLIIDVKTVKELEGLDDAVAETPDNTDTTDTVDQDETVTPTPTPTTKPAAPHISNTFSQDQQYIVTSMTGNKVGLNNYYFWDEGTFFEFSWGEKNKVGDSVIPNSTAYYKTENGKNYIYVEIENLSQEVFLSNNKTGTDLTDKTDTRGSNFVRIDVVSFQGGKATYKIEVKKKTDFKLVSQKTYDGTTQITSLQIKD